MEMFYHCLIIYNVQLPFALALPVVSYWVDGDNVKHITTGSWIQESPKCIKRLPNTVIHRNSQYLLIDTKERDNCFEPTNNGRVYCLMYLWDQMIYHILLERSYTKMYNPNLGAHYLGGYRGPSNSSETIPRQERQQTIWPVTQVSRDQALTPVMFIPIWRTPSPLP